MSATPAHSYTLEIFSDQHLVRDLTKGVLHTIFFHRYFPSIRPSLYTPSSSSGTAAPRTASATDTTLPIPLPCILDPPEIAAAIDSSVAELMSQLNTSSGPGNVPPGGTRSQIVVQFFERKRRKTGYTGGWLGRLGGGGAQTDEEVCWEEWCLKVVVARPRSEADRIKVRRAMESSLQKTALKIVDLVNKEKDHIPPITTSEQNPFPYRMVVNPKQPQNLEKGLGGWS